MGAYASNVEPFLATPYFQIALQETTLSTAWPTFLSLLIAIGG
jgi:hypothetical protein